jgi:hypothetical protein
MLPSADVINTQSPQVAPAISATPLINYVLKGLNSCWMPTSERWSHIYHLDGRPEPNESIPHSDVFYTLNVLLGFSRIRQFGPIHDYDLERIFRTNVVKVPQLKSRKYAYGMALWSAAELGFEIPGETVAAIRKVLQDRNGWMEFKAQDLGMLLIGCVEQARRGRRELEPFAHDLFKHLDAHYSCESGLFFDAATGLRKRFSSFATQTYLTLACYTYGEWASNRRALDLAKTCTRKLISLQGPQGEWPWFFYTPAGRVVDFYEVYAVHQDGMAPAFLEHAERHGVPGAQEALAKGFMWIYGDNQLRRSMLWKKEGLICRSQIRRGELESKLKRVRRAVRNAVTGGGQQLVSPSGVGLRLECRSYHLGWVLWSFGQRDDLPAIHHHASLSS